MVWLDDEDLWRFERDGYLVIPDVVPEPLLAAADEEIDALDGIVPPHEGDGGVGVNAWFLPRVQLPAGESVLRCSPALAIADEVVAPQSLDVAFDHVQVSTTTPPWHHRPGGPHIDGHAPGQDPPASFTLLAGVLLSDQRGPDSGNLWVWPGSHLAHQELFRSRGPAFCRPPAVTPTCRGWTRRSSCRHRCPSWGTVAIWCWRTTCSAADQILDLSPAGCRRAGCSGRRADRRCPR